MSDLLDFLANGLGWAALWIIAIIFVIWAAVMGLIVIVEVGWCLKERSLNPLLKYFDVELVPLHYSSDAKRVVKMAKEVLKDLDEMEQKKQINFVPYYAECLRGDIEAMERHHSKEKKHEQS